MATIIKRGKSYLIQVSMPDGQGGYIRKSSTYKPPLGSTPTQAKRGADAYAIEFENQCRGLTNFNDNITLDTLFEWYLKDIGPSRWKDSTAETKERYYQYYLQPFLGRRKLKELTPVIIDRAFVDIQTSGDNRKYYILKDADAFRDAVHTIGGSFRKMAIAGVMSVDGITKITKGNRTVKAKAQGIADYCNLPLDSLFVADIPKPLNSNTVKNARAVLSALLATATQKGIIKNNPMLHTEPIKGTPPKRTTMNIEQARIFLSRLANLENISVRALLVTALFTGARSGELRSLMWSDIDTQNGMIHINKNIDSKDRVTSTKTEKSTRYVQIDITMCAFLEHYRNEQEEHITNMCGRVADRGIVFPALTTGNYMNRHYPNSVIKLLIRDTDIPQDLHIHSLRHSFTSILINEGADVKKVASALGHTRIQTTMDIYGTIFAETLAKSMQGVSLALTNGGSIFGIEEDMIFQHK